MQLTAKLEPFDSFWEAPENIEKGYRSFHKFYKRNYLKFIPAGKEARILVVSCGPGYFVNLLKTSGYTNVLGIDSDSGKIAHAIQKGLNCQVARAFEFLQSNDSGFDVIVAEQELNHLTKDEIVQFLQLCHTCLVPNGTLIVHSLNGANPITGAEALAQNIDHFNSFTESSLRQILQLTRFDNVRVISLDLYVFYENPLNYVGMVVDRSLSMLFRFFFLLYGKSNKLFSKKIAAVAHKPANA